MKYVPPHNGDTEDPDRPYVDADPGNGIEGSYPAAKGIEHPQREIINAIVAAGLVPDSNELTQLAQAIGRLGVPVGAEIDWPFEDLPNGWYEKDGALLNRADLPQLWALVEASGLAVTEAAWSGGEFGKFSTGDGATTFRLPDQRGYSSRAWDHGRGIDAGRALGSAQEDAFQGFDPVASIAFSTGSGGNNMSRGNAAGLDYYNGGGGVIPSTPAQSWDAIGTAPDSLAVARGYIAADGTNGTPRVANETRTKSIAAMRIIYGGV